MENTCRKDLRPAPGVLQDRCRGRVDAGSKQAAEAVTKAYALFQKCIYFIVAALPETALVKWVYFALLNAEELGVGLDTIDEARASTRPDVRRLLGAEGTFGEDMGLSKDWAANIVKSVGNYGDIYDRNLGSGSPLGIPHGLNQLWSLGGIQYAPPIR
jgi:hypothetical protein